MNCMIRRRIFADSTTLSRASRPRRSGLDCKFRFNRCSSTTTTRARQPQYQDIYDKPASAYGWRYHLDNTTQFILWAAFGSAAIHVMNIKQKYKDKERRLSTKIAVLKDVIKRIGEGEDVDVARELQVGKTEAETEWEEVMNTFKEAAGLSPEEIAQLNECTRATAQPLQEDGTAVDPKQVSFAGITSKSSQGWFWQS